MDNLKIVRKTYIYFENEEGPVKFFGFGVVQLLKSINDFGSINLACKKLNLSYSKALKMIQNCESIINKPIIIHQKGGSDRAGATLTKVGKDLINIWDEYTRDIDNTISKRNNKLKGDMLDLIK